MGVVIDDPQTEAKIRQLAERTGETPTQAVARAVDERLAHLPPPRLPLSEEEIAARKRKLEEILAYFDSLPKINEHLTLDEIIGYDENGLPT